MRQTHAVEQHNIITLPIQKKGPVAKKQTANFRGIDPAWGIGKLFGEQHWCAKWLIDLCHLNCQLLVHITEQSADYVHYICLVRLALLEQGDENETDAHYARLLQIHSRKRVLQDLYQPCPEGILPVLPKLGNKPLSMNDYARLVRLIADKNAQKYLAHTIRIYPYHLYWLEKLPVEFRSGKIIRCIRNSSDYQTVQYIIKAVLLMDPAPTQSQINMAMRNMKNLAQLGRWFQRQLVRMPFPSPPWIGNDWIQPVCSARELMDVKKHFKNCVFDFCDEILLGNKYFYISSRGPAVISIQKDPCVGWNLGAMKGKKNKALSSWHKRQITRAFSDAGIDLQLEDDIWWRINHEDWD